jgi:Extensin-like protein C-terminus
MPHRNRAEPGKMSAHASGLTVDVASFELANGRTLAIKPNGDEHLRATVDAIRVAACGWGGALSRKFGMRVIADGTCGTPTKIRPPGFTACTIWAKRVAGALTCSRTWNAQTAS